MSYLLEFTERSLPPTVNAMGRWHWTRKVRLAKIWQNIVRAYVLDSGRAGSPPLTRARITLTRCSSSEPDFDGLVSSFKVVLDALVKNGIIIDDKPSVIGTPTYLWEKAKPMCGSIKVRVEGGE